MVLERLRLWLLKSLCKENEYLADAGAELPEPPEQPIPPADLEYILRGRKPLDTVNTRAIWITNTERLVIVKTDGGHDLFMRYRNTGGPNYDYAARVNWQFQGLIAGKIDCSSLNEGTITSVPAESLCAAGTCDC